MPSSLSVNGTTLAYEIAGDSGPWVLLLHGGGLDQRMWAPQVPALAHEFRVLTYDLRGYGASGAPITGYGPDTDQEDLEALLAALGIAEAHFVGLSLGAAILQRFAVERPEQVITLTLAGGAATPTPSDPAFVAHTRALLAMIGTERVETILRHNLNGPFIAQSKGTPNWPFIERIMLEHPGTRITDPARGTYPPPRIDPSQHIDALTMPLLIIEGARDLPGVLAKGPWLQERLPHAQRVRLPNAGHLANLDDPDGFNAALLAFLRAHRAANAHRREPVAGSTIV